MSPTVARIAEHMSARFQAAQTLTERQDIQRQHIAAIARDSADTAFVAVEAHPDLSEEDAETCTQNILTITSCTTDKQLVAHGLGEPLVPPVELADIAFDAFVARLRELHSGPWARGQA